jgi:CubicO group peptidase (beta-lactamase class C family)
MIRRTLLGPALLTALTAAPGAGDEIDDYIAAEMAARRIPGLALAVARRGEIIRTSDYGLANVELEAPVKQGSAFPIASLDKELTAAGVMRLVQSGRVSLEDPLARYLEGAWRGIRIRHLLSHTSGLPDKVAPDVEGRLLSEYTTEALLATIRELESVAPPGERFLYSDANFVLAQLVIERASGESWRPFMEREVFAPAGMEAVAYFDPPALLPGRVAPYTRDTDGRLRRDPYRDIDFGPLYNDVAMTARDFARWLLALDDDRVLSRESRNRMWTPARLNDGREVREVGQWRGYGLGFGLDAVFGRRVVTHSGYTGVGFVKLPEEELSVVVFTNLRHSAGSDPVGLAYGVLGFVQPEVALLTRRPAPDPDPARTAALRAEYERWLGGVPDLELWAPPLRAAAWEEAAALAGRNRSLGPLHSFELLDGEPGEGERLFLARHERGRLFLRISLDRDGRIAGLLWHHV